LSYIIISNARCGTTYLNVLIYNYLIQCDNNAVNLNEVFHRNTSIDHLQLNKKQLNVVSDQTLNQTPSDGKRSIRNNQTTLNMLRTATNQWICKIHMRQLSTVNTYQLFQLMDRDDVTTIFMYREDIEDTILSNIFAVATDTFNTSHDIIDDYMYYDYTNSIDHTLRQNDLLLNMYNTYPNWNYVVKYEDLTESHKHNGKMVGINFDKCTLSLPQKMRLKSDKIKAMSNYSEFKTEFDTKVSNSTFTL